MVDTVVLVVRSIWLVGISWLVCGVGVVSINCAFSVLGCLMVCVPWMEVEGLVDTVLVVRSIWLVGISWLVCGVGVVSINCACSVLGCLMVRVTWMEVWGSLLV